MPKTIQATVVYPNYIQVEVEDDWDEYKIREEILRAADYNMEASPQKPIITECDDDRFAE